MGKKYVLKRTSTNGLVIYALMGKMNKLSLENKELEKRRKKDEHKY